MPRVLSYVLTAGLTACCALSAQTTITGRLQQKRGDTLTPVRDCTVYARSLDAGPLVGEYPDHQGRFALEFPPDGRVTVGTICPGYRVIAVNGRPVPRLTFDCSEPGHCATVELTLEPRAVVEGFVVDQAGLPVERVSVELRHGPAGRSHRHNRVSDDRGYFRFFHLPPDEYVLSPVDLEERVEGLMWEGEPQRIVVGPGDVESGVQVRLRFLEPLELTGRISGLPPGTTSVELTVVGISDGRRVGSGGTVAVDAEGRFRLPGLQRGQYRVLMRPRGDGGERYSSEESYIGSVDLQRDGGEFDFAPRKPTRLTGTLEVEWARRDGPPQRGEREIVLFWLVAEDGVKEHVRTDAPEYGFDVKNLRPGRYRLDFTGQAPRVDRRTRGGEWKPISDVVLSEGTTTKLDLRVRFEVGRLAVLVRPARGSEDAEQRRPAAHYLVGLRRDGQVMFSPTDQNGHLVLSAVPGGDYEICAWRRITRKEAAAPAAWQKAGEAVRRFRLEDDVDMEITLTAAP